MLYRDRGHAPGNDTARSQAKFVERAHKAFATLFATRVSCRRPTDITELAVALRGNPPNKSASRAFGISAAVRAGLLGSDEWVLRADLAPSLATPVGALSAQLRRPRPRSATAGLRRFATFNRRETSIRVGSGPSSHPSKGAAGFEGYEAVDLIRRYPATARRSALLR